MWVKRSRTHRVRPWSRTSSQVSTDVGEVSVVRDGLGPQSEGWGTNTTTSSPRHRKHPASVFSSRLSASSSFDPDLFDESDRGRLVLKG